MSTSSDQWNSGKVWINLGTAIYHYPVLDSTNACAHKLLSQFRPKSGTLILADHQTAGKGQAERKWHSSSGLNLNASYILYPPLKALDQFLINMAVALAVCDAITSCCRPGEVKIKWPNDIYIRDKKTSGILIQNSIQGDQIRYSVAGIGLNVNETEFPTWIPHATSLKLAASDIDNGQAQKDLEIPKIIDALNTALSIRLLQCERESYQLKRDYQQALYRYQIQSQFKFPDTSDYISGSIEGVDTIGRLCIRWANGELKSYQHREVELVLNT